jgi:hypothetical protein
MIDCPVGEVYHSIMSVYAYILDRSKPGPFDGEIKEYIYAKGKPQEVEEAMQFACKKTSQVLSARDK